MLAEAWPEGRGTLSFLRSVIKGELGYHTQLLLSSRRKAYRLLRWDRE